MFATKEKQIHCIRIQDDENEGYEIVHATKVLYQQSRWMYLPIHKNKKMIARGIPLAISSDAFVSDSLVTDCVTDFIFSYHIVLMNSVAHVIRPIKSTYASMYSNRVSTRL